MRRAGDSRLPPTRLRPSTRVCSLWPCKKAPGPLPGVREPSCCGTRGKCWGVLCSLQLGIGRGVVGKLGDLRKSGCLDTQKSFACYDFFSLIRQMLSSPAASCRDSGHLLVASWFARIIIILGTTHHRGLRGSENGFCELTLSQSHSSPSFLSSTPYFFPFP